jgi:hypothetical protein
VRIEKLIVGLVAEYVFEDKSTIRRDSRQNGFEGTIIVYGVSRVQVDPTVEGRASFCSVSWTMPALSIVVESMQP